jgi:hypothetical protein
MNVKHIGSIREHKDQDQALMKTALLSATCMSHEYALQDLKYGKIWGAVVARTQRLSRATPEDTI